MKKILNSLSVAIFFFAIGSAFAGPPTFLPKVFGFVQ